MRRPLFAVALCLVFFVAIWLKWNGDEWVCEGCISAEELVAETLLVTGQVYQKEEDSIYIKSVFILNSNAFGQSAAESRQDISNLENRIKEDTNLQNLKQEIVRSENLICQVDGAVRIPLGATVIVQGTFSPFLQATNPGEFNSAIYYRSLEVAGKLKDATINYVGEDYWHIREWLYGVKVFLQERIYRIFPKEDAAIVEALLLGEKGNLDSETKNLYKRNGILHILSISAMHVSIVGMSVYKLLRKVGIPMWLAAVLGGILLLFYGALTGFGVSATRAIGMYLIRMFGEVVGRSYDMLTALGAVGALMVLDNPYCLDNGGFLLSFGCVLGIGVVYPALLPEFSKYQGNNRLCRNKWERCREFLREAELSRRIGSSFFLSLSVTLATLPLQLYLYYEVPVFSVFLNLLVVPFLKPLMITGIMAVALPGTYVLEGIVTGILSGYEFACQCFDRLPYHTWNPGCPKTWQIVVYYCLLLGVVGMRSVARGKMKDLGRREYMKGVNLQPGKRLKYGTNGFKRSFATKEALISASLLFVAILLLGVRPAVQNRVTFLDVGQGTCIVVRLASGENYLFDCGSVGRSNVGQYVLLPYLKYMGIRTLDAVFVSHPDADHTSGILELFSLCGETQIVIKQLILPDIEENASEEQLEEIRQAALGAKAGNEIPISYISKGEGWECESASFLCLHPYANYSGEDSNQYSECFYVKFYKEGEGEQSLLLTGDVGKEAEKDLVESLLEYGISEIDVFQGAHHGSKYSNSEELLKISQPTVTVISCGRNNSYGHPHQETLDRLEAVGSAVLTTPECGAITIEMREELVIYGFKE